MAYYRTPNFIPGSAADLCDFEPPPGPNEARDNEWHDFSERPPGDPQMLTVRLADGRAVRSWWNGRRFRLSGMTLPPEEVVSWRRALPVVHRTV